jgi:hypothetical protein
MAKSIHLKASVIGLAAAALFSGTAEAQDGPSATSGVLNFTTSVVSDSNEGLDPVSAGTSLSASEILSLGVVSETRTQSFRFSIDTGITYDDDPAGGTTLTFASPDLDFGYSRQSANSSFNLGASYNTGDVVDAIGQNPAAVAVDDGIVNVTSVSFGLQTGIEAPVGFDISGSAQNSDYAGTTDPDLVDNQDMSLSASVNLRFSPVTDGSITASRSSSSAETAGNLKTETVSYSFGLSHELRRGLSVSGSLGMRENTTTEFLVTSETDGLFGNFGISQDLPNGSIFGDLSFDESEAVRSTSLTFGGSTNLKDGALSASITATADGVFGNQVLGSLDYSKELASGAITVGLSQSIEQDVLDNDQKFSSVEMSYSQEINSVSGFDLSLDLSQTKDLTTSDTSTFTELSVGYSREVTRDWDLSVGYSHRRFSETGSADADSDSLYLSLSRSVALSF